MTEAKVLTEPTIQVRDEGMMEGTRWASTDCAGYREFVKLPNRIMMGGTILGKTGFNSDSGRAGYSSQAWVLNSYAVADHGQGLSGKSRATRGNG